MGFHGIELHLELVSMGHHVLAGAESCDGCQYDVRYVSQPVIKDHGGPGRV
jgi:hypothetical protein